MRWLLIAWICGGVAETDCERQIIGTFRDQSVCITAGLTLSIRSEFECRREIIPLPRPRPHMRLT